MARIIRTADSRGPSLGAQNRAFETGSSDALVREMIAMAESEAQRLVAAGHVEAEAIRRDAEEDAVSIRAKANERKQQVLDDEVTWLRELFQQLGNELEGHAQHWRQVEQVDMVDLALAIAKRIVVAHIDDDSDLVTQTTREALESLSMVASITLCVSPADFDSFRQTMADLCAELHPTAHCEIRSDPDIVRGGARIETEIGIIDQTIDAQVARVGEELIAEDSYQQMQRMDDDSSRTDSQDERERSTDGLEP